MLVAAAAVIALVFFLRDRNITLRYRPLILILQRLRHWLAALRLGATRRTTSVRHILSRGLRRLLPVPDRRQVPWRFLRINALPPREQIRYFYLSTVRRAADEGVPRDKSETPSEYARDLQAQWPDAGEEIEALTESFLEARYSAHPFQREDIDPVKKIWKRVRRAIRRRLGS